MYTSIKGIYENGTLTLLEPAPKLDKSEVLITFLSEELYVHQRKKRRVLGGLRHIGGSIPDNFNAPLDDLKEYM